MFRLFNSELSEFLLKKIPEINLKISEFFFLAEIFSSCSVYSGPHRVLYKTNFYFVLVWKAVIGPPLLSVAGCGTCIQGNISMPDLDPYTKDHAVYYDFSYTVRWRKGNGGEIQVKYISYIKFLLYTAKISSDFLLWAISVLLSLLLRIFCCSEALLYS